MKNFFAVLLVLMSLVGLGTAQTPSAIITGDAQGVVGAPATTYPVQIRFQVVGCGTETPRLHPHGNVIVNTVTSAPLTQPALQFTQTLWGNDVIECGGQTYTTYAVTWLINGLPAAPTANYRLTQGATCNISDGTCLPVGFTPPIIARAANSYCPTNAPFLTGFNSDYTPKCSPGQPGPPGPSGAGGADASTFCAVSGTYDQTCLANVSATGQSPIVLSKTFTINSSITISQSNVRFSCINGGGIKQNSDTAQVTITGTNVYFDNCTIDTNSKANQAMEVNAASNFTFANGKITNSSNVTNYGIRADHGVGLSFLNNTCATPNSFCFQTFDSSNILASGNSGIGHIGIMTSNGSPLAGGSIAVLGNNLAPSKENFSIEIGDFSVGSNPITNLSVIGNNTLISGTSGSAKVHGAISIVGDTAKCTIANNTIRSENQWLDAPALEAGVHNCAITGNQIYAPDSNGQTYQAIAVYGGQNTITSNTVGGWGTSSDGGIFVYPQGHIGPNFTTNADYNVIANNQVLGINNTNSIGIWLQCNSNVGGTSLRNQKIIGNNIGTISGTLFRAINVEDDFPGPPDNCPVSAAIDNNSVSNSVRGIQIGNVNPVNIGKNDFQNISSDKVLVFGTSVLTNAEIASPIVTPALTPTALTPSVNALCYPTANQPVTNVGCAAVNAGQVTFTPTTAGWYRIINGGFHAVDRGDVDIWSPWIGQQPVLRVTFSMAQSGAPSMVKVTNLGQYAGGYGPIDKIRASTDGSSALYLDIHISNVTNVAPLTMVFYGVGVAPADIVANPVVGAVVGGSSVATADLSTLVISSTVSASSLETGVHYAYSYVAQAPFNGEVDLTSIGTPDPAAPIANTIRLTVPNTVTSYAIQFPGIQPQVVSQQLQCTPANPAVCSWVNPTPAATLTTGTPTVGQAACIKAAGPPVVIGYCSTVVSSGGACTCN